MSRRSWTEQEENILRFNVGYKSIPQLARKLNRTPQSVKRHGLRLGLQWSAAARTRAGMTPDDVAAALGVHRKTVFAWIRLKRLKAERCKAERRLFYSINPDDLTAMIQVHGAMLRLTPDADWLPVVEDARRAFLTRHIAHPELIALLCVVDRTIYTWRGFPSPVIKRQPWHPSYYEKAAVRAWLRANPARRTRQAQEAGL